MSKTFKEFITEQTYPDDPRLDFKEDVERDSRFPSDATASREGYRRIKNYLSCCRACSGATRAFRAVWAEYYKDQTGAEFPERLYR